MSTLVTLKKIGFMVVVLATLAAFSASAAVAPVATIGPVTVVGATYSGGSIYYQFNLTTTAPGVLVVKGKLTGTKLSASFPDLIATNAAAGVVAEKGKTLTVPATFAGNAKLQLTVTFNKKAIVVKPIVVVIGSQPPPAGSVAVNIYDVGFGNSVVLDASVVSTLGLGTPTYSWTQMANSLGSKAPGTLSANNVVAPTLTTGAATNFVLTASTPTTVTVDEVDNTGATNALFVVPEHRFGTDAGLSLDNELVTESTYVYRVLVSGNSITRTGTFTVACSIQGPAHPNIPVGVTAYYKGATNSTNWTLLAKPAASAATLTHTNDLFAQLRPDVEGIYVIRDNVTGRNITNIAASYVGWTGTLGVSCDNCHGPGGMANSSTNASGLAIGDVVSPWQNTLHATMAERGINGVLSSHYSEACFVCHTLGYNKAPTAASNGNFYAVEKQLGWTFPSVLASTNYAAMPTRLQNLANIQCESCHGPGSKHPGPNSISMDARVCSQCHQNGSNHVHPEQWEVSPHAGGYETISSSEGGNPVCARCHSPNGFVDGVKRLNAGVPLSVVATSVATGSGPLTCQACHDPHNSAQFPAAAHQVRVYDSVTIGDGTKTNGIVNPDGSVTLTNSTVTLTGKGTSALCISCHNARALPYQNAGTPVAPTPVYMRSLPHESPVAEVLEGIGAAVQGQVLGNSFHTYLADCTTCHMYASSTNTVGNHTFSMTDRQTGADNVAACNQCHEGAAVVTNFDYVAVNAEDYDGNGKIEGIQTEVQGLLTILSNKFADVGIAVYDAYPFVNAANYTSVTNQYPAEALPIRRALWNRVLIVREGSLGVHNTQFTIRLLQSSYTDLSTNCISMTTHTNGRPFAVDYPKAFLR